MKTEEEIIYEVCSRKGEEGLATWTDVARVLNAKLGNNFSESAYRKKYQIFGKMLEANRGRFTDLEQYENELLELKDEIYKERCKLQDANREKRKNLREQARFENLLDTLKEFTEKASAESAPSYSYSTEDSPTKYAILCLSDWHLGAIVDNQFNYYDVDVAKERAYTIRDKAITYCMNHDVTDLVVEINGDMIDGAIHVSSRVAQEENTLEQIVTIVDLLAKVISSMKPYFHSIKVVTTLGNHGRLTPNKKDCSTGENFEMIIPHWLRDKKEMEDITIIESYGTGFAKYNIGNKVICVSHGDNDKLATVIGDFSKLFGEVPNEIHLGHTHGYKDINDCNVYVSVNGSLIGSNDYSLGLRKVTAPSQNLIIYENNDRCIYELKAE